MVIARSTRERIPYVLRDERDLPPEQQTTFLLAALPNHAMLSILQMMQHGQSKAWIEVALTAGLRGWENFNDADGNATPFRREDNQTRTLHGVEIKGPVSRGTLEVLPAGILLELAEAIVSANKLTVEDAKN
jgi:hypothetical protein